MIRCCQVVQITPYKFWLGNGLLNEMGFNKHLLQSLKFKDDWLLFFSSKKASYAAKFCDNLFVSKLSLSFKNIFWLTEIFDSYFCIFMPCYDQKKFMAWHFRYILSVIFKWTLIYRHTCKGPMLYYIFRSIIDNAS